MNIKGSFVALITPFTEAGAIDFLSLRKLVQKHMQEGTNGLVCLGSTGEKSTLSQEEQKKIVEIVLEESQGRLPVIVGTGTNNTAESIDFTRVVKSMGAAAALVIVPYYNRPTEEGCFYHFQEIAQIGLPIIAYHHPGRTGLFISCTGWKKIASIPQIIAIKESSRKISFMQELFSEISKPIICGDDDLLLSSFEMGAVGSISVIANLLPRKWSEVIHLLLQRENLAAKDRFLSLLSLLEAIFLESNPIGVKWAMHLLGLCEPFLRLPLTIASEEARQKISQAVCMIQNTILQERLDKKIMPMMN